MCSRAPRACTLWNTTAVTGKKSPGSRNLYFYPGGSDPGGFLPVCGAFSSPCVAKAARSQKVVTLAKVYARCPFKCSRIYTCFQVFVNLLKGFHYSTSSSFSYNIGRDAGDILGSRRAAEQAGATSRKTPESQPENSLLRGLFMSYF